MKNRDLKKMTPEEKKAMRKAAATVMGEILVYETEMNESQKPSDENEQVNYPIEGEGEE